MSPVEDKGNTTSCPSRVKAYLFVLFVGMTVFVAAIIGTLTRQWGLPAVIWPANAILVGLMFRFPRYPSIFTLIAAYIGFFLADLVCGRELLTAIGLSTANMLEVIIIYGLYIKIPSLDTQLKTPTAILHLFFVSVLGAIAGSIVGATVFSIHFHTPFTVTFFYWFAGETLSSITILPVLLTCPRLSFRALKKHPFQFKQLFPLLTLIASALLMFSVSGPGAIAFPAMALIWCALSYDFFVNAMLVMTLAVILNGSEALHLLPFFTQNNFAVDTVSFRIGITMLSLAPLSVASINAARNELIRKLDYSVNHDHLTGILSRKALEQRGASYFTLPKTEQSVALMMLDLDYFKQVNDQYGHQAGDQLLIHFTQKVSELIRSQDLFGRMGGEEFALVLSNLSYQDAISIAERIRTALGQHPIQLKNHQHICVTVSIGLVYLSRSTTLCSWDQALGRADKALYRAKATGRNQVCVWGRHSLNTQHIRPPASSQV